MLKDLQDWARQAGLTIAHAAHGVPGQQRQGDARLHLAASRKDMVPFATRGVRGLLGPRRGHLAGRGAGRRSASSCGIDAAGLAAGIAEPAIKDQLKANTDELIARGGFGSPTIFVDGDDMYFGNDRLPLVREALLRQMS